MKFSKSFKLSKGSQCTYPCCPPLEFLGILSKPLAALPRVQMSDKRYLVRAE